MKRLIFGLALGLVVACDSDTPPGQSPVDAASVDMRIERDVFVPFDSGRPVEAGTDAGRDGCESGTQCPSGFCVPSPDGARVCTDLCADDRDCPAGWECRAVLNTEPDTVFICVARRNIQCDTCR
ncbi:MAG: hypothetical protein R3F60_02705 [bacterium]